MNEEDTNINETIENDMKNRNQGPVESKIRKKGKKEAKKLAKKARKKMRNTLFKKAGLSAIIGFFPLFIIIFMIVGIISFVTTMPGLVQEEILNKLLSFGSNLNYKINGSDYYLTELAKDRDRKAQKEILLYLDNMGVDPVGFGFAPFYTLRKTQGQTEEVTKENATWKNVDYETTIDPQDIRDVGGFVDSIKYNNELAKKALNEDLILKYIIANERAFLVHDLDKIGNWSSTLESVREYLGSDFDLHGMVVIKIPGLDDSTITVDRDKKQMIIDSINFKFDWFDSEIYEQTAKYNLDGWAGRYGMPLEFLLALHIGTMTADLTDEMLSNPSLQTEVRVEGEKGEYDVEYEIKYDGKELPFKADRGGTNDKLLGLLDYFKLDDNNDVYIDLTDDELLEYKDDVSINSLAGLLDSMFSVEWNFNINFNDRLRVMEDTKNEFLGDGEYRVRYELFGNVEASENAIWRISSFFGRVEELSDTQISKGYAYNPRIPYDADKGLKSGINSYQDFSYESDGYVIQKFRYSDTLVDGIWGERLEDRSGYIEPSHTGNVYVSFTGPEPVNLKEKVGLSNEWQSADTSGQQAYTTAILHGLDYYINGYSHEVVNNEYIQLGIACILSQIDSFMCSEHLEAFSDDIHFRVVEGYSQGGDVTLNVYDEAGDDYFEFDLPYGLNVSNPSGEKVEWLLTAHWLQYLHDNKGNYTYDGMQQELEYLRDNILIYYELIYNKSGHVQDAIDRFFHVLYGSSFTLSVSDIYDIYNALCNNDNSFEYVLPRIKYVIGHWYKDVIYEGAGVNVYKKTNDPIILPLVLDTEANKPLEINAILTGDSNYVQTGQPYVVKGDVVTVDGKLIEDPVEGYDLPTKDASSLESNPLNIDTGYKLGDGYRITKKLFTQGQYYVFDGSAETAKSIWFAKRLEKINGSDKKFAKAYVQNGRIILSWVFDGNSVPSEFGNSYNGGSWDVSTQEIDDTRKNDEVCKPKMQSIM